NIASPQTVMVTAVATSNSARVATATIRLLPNAISPRAVSMAAGQSRQFTANFGGKPISWSVTPAVGVVSASGVYTAPTSVATTQMLVLTAAVTGSPAQSASTTITLLPALVTPQNPALAPSQAQKFTAWDSNGLPASPRWIYFPQAGSLAQN